MQFSLKIYKILFFILLLSLALPLRADKLFLEDGEVLHGRFLGKYNNRYKFKTREGTVRYVPEDKVYDLKMGELQEIERPKPTLNPEPFDNNGGVTRENYNKAEPDPFPNPNKPQGEKEAKPDKEKDKESDTDKTKNGFYSNWLLGGGQLTITDRTGSNPITGATIPANSYRSIGVYSSFSMGWAFSSIVPLLGVGFIYKLPGNTKDAEGNVQSVSLNEYMAIVGVSFLTGSNFNIGLSVRSVLGGNYSASSSITDFDGNKIEDKATAKISGVGNYGFGLDIGKYWIINSHFNMGLTIFYFNDSVKFLANDFENTPRQINSQLLGFGMNMMFH